MMFDLLFGYRLEIPAVVDARERRGRGLLEALKLCFRLENCPE